MKEIKVSIVIPCYNAAAFMKECLESVRSQLYQNVELICIDDGSLDTTLDIITSFRERHFPTLQIIHNPTNQGAQLARNQGLNAASGFYLQYLDADDVLLPDKISHQVAEAKQNSLPDLIVGSYERRLKNGKLLDLFQPNSQYGSDWLRLFKSEMGITSANLWKREKLIELGGWNQSMRSSQEYELMLRMLENDASIHYVAPVHTIVREKTTASISRKSPADSTRTSIELRVKMLHRFQEEGKEEESREAYQHLFHIIRDLFLFDEQEALRLHDMLIPKRFKPRFRTLNGKVFQYLHSLWGFKYTTRTWKTYKRVFKPSR